MNTTETHAAACEPEYFMRDGKLARRTFIKGVGAITVASALGFGMSGVGVSAAEADEVPVAAGEKAVHAVCTANCTSRCHLRGMLMHVCVQ